MKAILIISLLFLTTILHAQERVLLHINRYGQQEAIPLKKGESPKTAIERQERMRADLISPERSSGVVDTLRHYPSANDLTTNFGWTHQDVALQWYVPQAGGQVTEVWWYNYLKNGTSKKATIRAWNIDSRVLSYPGSPNSKYLGTYKDPTDGDGGVQPFKPESGDQWFYSNGMADSVTYSFDPVLSEAKWLKGGIQVTLDSNAWQGLKLDSWGDTMLVNNGKPFGFTLSNDTKLSDIGGGTDERMEILSWANTAGAPYHSLKYYETGRTSPDNKGWHLRGDYEWGMYVVVEYTTCTPPRFIVNSLGTTLSTDPREVCFTFAPGDCGGTPVDSTMNILVFYKKGLAASYDSSNFPCSKNSCCITVPGGNPGDTIYWYVAFSDDKGNRTVTPARNYRIFKQNSENLFIFNNSQFSINNANMIYTGGNINFDRWSAPLDGIGEMNQLMSLYNNILIADGSFPSRNVFSSLKTRYSVASLSNPLAVFFTSHDYGCYIEPHCADTSFTTGTLEYDYFGITKIGPQDLPPTTRPFRLIPQQDAVTDYLVKYGADNGSTLWHFPSFELQFSGYPDAMSPRAEAKALFKDNESRVTGVKFITPSTRTAYIAFDAGALQFRSDTSLAPINDPKYKWINDVGSVALSFFKEHGIVASAHPSGQSIPASFSLSQNFPNPFNPTTTVEYSVASKEHVAIEVFNTLGQVVSMVVNDVRVPGVYRAEWNASHVSSGLYFYRMRAGRFVDTKKMVVIK